MNYSAKAQAHGQKSTKINQNTNLIPKPSQCHINVAKGKQDQI